MIEKVKQQNAYTKHMNRYDDVLTGRKWWSYLYMRCLWRMDDNAIAREVLAMIPDDFDGTIFDIPVGTAVFTAAKYRRMPRARITGADYSREMLDIAAVRIAQEGMDNFILQQADVCSLPYRDDSFDIVLSMNGIHAFPPNKSLAFAEMHRVLKAGGMFCGCFYIKGEHLPADWFVRCVLEKKGFFMPPHYTLEQAEELFLSLYGNGHVYLKRHRSILLFKCIK